MDATKEFQLPFTIHEIGCPLDSSKTFSLWYWSLVKVVDAIEHHIHTDTTCPHPHLQDLEVIGLEEYERSTPLLMACSSGHLKAVKQIVEGWGVNVSTVATHPIGGVTVSGVTPLFVAALHCHTDVVRYLVGKGAQVSTRTALARMPDEHVGLYFGATPLHAAVRNYSFFDHEERTSTIRFLLECGADPSVLTQGDVPIWSPWDSSGSEVITLLVRWGLDLGQRCPVSGITLLHLWAGNRRYENGALEVVKLLLEKGADPQARDNSGLSVILTAAIGDDRFPNLIILDYLLERNDIARIDKIEALEMAGALLLSHDQDDIHFLRAFQYWRRALHLRSLDTEGCGPICKQPMKSKSGQLTEWSTLDDLLQIEQQPALHEIQSLLVRYRILSRLSCHAFYHHLFGSILSYLQKDVDENRPFLEMIDIACTAMETIFRYDPMESGLLQSEAFKIVQQMKDIIGKFDDADINSETLKTLLDLVSIADQFPLRFISDYMRERKNDTVLDGITQTFVTLSRRPEMLTEEIKQSLEQLVRRDCRDSRGSNLLHNACYYLCDYSLFIVCLLLKLRVDTNAVNNDGDGPLHILAMDMYMEDVETRDTIARLLLDSGAHLDMVNKEGMTPADLWLKECKEREQIVDWRDLPGWLQQGVPKLKCLSSRVIRRHRVPYEDEELVPPVLIRYVAMH